MKLIIIGSSKPFALESFYQKHIVGLGHQIEIFPASDQFLQFYMGSMLNKLLFRTGISTIYKKINKRLLNHIQLVKPDVVLIFKGMEIFPETIKIIKEKGIAIANFNPDHPFIFHGKGSGNKNVTNSIGLYDLHLTYNLHIKKQLEQKFNLPCAWVPFGYEPTNLLLPSEKEEIKRVCFIGYADKQRAKTIKQITNAEIPIDLYGPNWLKFLKPSNILRIHPSVFNDAFNKTALKYRIQLNLFRPQNNGSHNMRSFEMPGIGCIMLGPDSAEHRQFYEEGKEVFLHHSTNDLINQIKNILELPFSKANEIRQNAIARSIQSKYTYADRAAQLMDILKQYTNK